MLGYGIPLWQKKICLFAVLGQTLIFNRDLNNLLYTVRRSTLGKNHIYVYFHGNLASVRTKRVDLMPKSSKFNTKRHSIDNFLIILYFGIKP